MATHPEPCFMGYCGGMRVMENPWSCSWTCRLAAKHCLPICCTPMMLWLGLGEACQAPFSKKSLQAALDVVKIGHSLTGHEFFLGFQIPHQRSYNCLKGKSSILKSRLKIKSKHQTRLLNEKSFFHPQLSPRGPSHLWWDVSVSVYNTWI